MNLSLLEQKKSWVEQQFDVARFSNYSDYVPVLIHRDQERGVVIVELQTDIDPGLNNRPSAPLDTTAF